MREGSRKTIGEARKGKEWKERRGEGKEGGEAARERSGEVLHAITSPSLVSCAIHAELFRLLIP